MSQVQEFVGSLLHSPFSKPMSTASSDQCRIMNISVLNGRHKDADEHPKWLYTHYSQH